MPTSRRHRVKPRPRGEPQPERQSTTWLTGAERAEVDRRAATAGLSRSAFQRAVLLADGGVCAVLQATIAEREERIASLEEQLAERDRCFGLQIAALESQLEKDRLRCAREVDGWELSDVVERRWQAHELTYG